MSPCSSCAPCSPDCSPNPKPSPGRALPPARLATRTGAVGEPTPPREDCPQGQASGTVYRRNMVQETGRALGGGDMALDGPELPPRRALPLLPTVVMTMSYPDSRCWPRTKSWATWQGVHEWHARVDEWMHIRRVLEICTSLLCSMLMSVLSVGASSLTAFSFLTRDLFAFCESPWCEHDETGSGRMVQLHQGQRADACIRQC